MSHGVVTVHLIAPRPTSNLSAPPPLQECFREAAVGDQAFPALPVGAREMLQSSMQGRTYPLHALASLPNSVDI